RAASGQFCLAPRTGKVFCPLFKGVLLFITALFLAAFSASAQGTANVTLSWTMTDTNATDYHIYWGTASGSYTNDVDAGDASNVTISNLVVGTTYYFVADDSDSNGDVSAPSAEVAFTVPPPNPPSVTLTSPGSSAHFLAPALFNLS